MDVMALVVLCAAVAGLLVAGWMHLDRLDAGVRGRAGRRPAAPARSAGSVGCAPAVPDDPGKAAVPAGPPLVAGDDGSTTTLRDWLVHLHPDRHNAWAEVTREFCDAMAAHPDVAGYFAADHREVLQKHFLAALILITGSGVSAADLDRIRDHHAHVRDARGRGITPGAYDTAMRILLDLLRARDIPADAIGQLMVILYLVGEVVATEPEPRPAAAARSAG